MKVNWGDFAMGVSAGFAATMGFITLISPAATRLEKFSLDHGIAHYNSKTGKYTQDSLIIVDDSTIRIRRDAR